MQRLWLENTDTVSWNVLESYYFLSPAIGGSQQGDGPLYAPDMHAYYMTGAAWIDKAVGLGVGCWFLQDPALECTYWVDKLGRYRSDMRYHLSERLAPGQRWTVPGPLAFFFPLEGVTREDYEAAAERLQARVVVGGIKAEPERAR